MFIEHNLTMHKEYTGVWLMLLVFILNCWNMYTRLKELKRKLQLLKLFLINDDIKLK